MMASISDSRLHKPQASLQVPGGIVKIEDGPYAYDIVISQYIGVGFKFKAK